MPGPAFRLPSPEEFERARLEGERLSRLLAEQGWVVPMNMPPADAWSTVDQPQTGSIDEFFVAHYTSEGGRYFDEIVRDSRGLRQRRVCLLLVSSLLSRPRLEFGCAPIRWLP